MEHHPTEAELRAAYVAVRKVVEEWAIKEWEYSFMFKGLTSRQRNYTTSILSHELRPLIPDEVKRRQAIDKILLALDYTAYTLNMFEPPRDQYVRGLLRALWRCLWTDAEETLNIRTKESKEYCEAQEKEDEKERNEREKSA